MNMLLGFVPFTVFAVAEHIFGVVSALTAAAAASFAIIARDVFSGRTPKLLELGSAILLYVPSIPLWVGIAITLAALVAAFELTSWHPEYAETAS